MPTPAELEEEQKVARAALRQDPTHYGIVSDDGRRLYTIVNGHIVLVASTIDLNKLSDLEIRRIVGMLRRKHALYSYN